MNQCTSLTKVEKPLTEEAPKILQRINEQFILDDLADNIRYYDEILTQSARNYAFTEDRYWKERYLETEPLLDKDIKAVISYGGEIEEEFFSVVHEANLALVEMEYNSIDLVDAGQTGSAIEILESEKYREQKDYYQKALEDYIKSRGLEFTETRQTSIERMKEMQKQIRSIISERKFSISILLAAFLILTGILAIFIYMRLIRPIKTLKEGVDIVQSGNLDYKIAMDRKDEIGEFSQAFDKMVETIKKTKAGIEKKIKERTEQLKKINKYMIGREIKMSELKKKLREKEKNENQD